MGRTLLVLRHSKAANPFGIPDVERPLSDRGRRDAAAIGTRLKDAALRPERVLCSPAVRTRQTLECLGLGTGAGTAGADTDADVEVDYAAGIYDGTERDLLGLVGETGDHVRTLLLVGHNPAVHHLVFDLTGGGASDGFPTSALAVIGVGDGPEGWSGVRPGVCELTALWRP